MPNYCQNIAHITHPDPKMIERAKLAIDEGRLFQEFFPCPQELWDTEESAITEERRNAFIKKYGSADWYNWCISNWGTKWDCCEGFWDGGNEDPNYALLNFETAWSPPLGVYFELMEQGFTVEAYYYEPGMQFAGHWENGVDDWYEDWGNADGAEKTLPEDLNELFAISEVQREYEEMEAYEDENEDI